jgi:hypothetical protein
MMHTKNITSHKVFLSNSKKAIFSLIIILILVNSGNVATILGYESIEPFEPQTIKNGEIPNLGPYTKPRPKEYRSYLEEGHKYHIFLVGGWITNRTDLQNATTQQEPLSRTDYDIEVRNPNNRVVSINTESAGLPEQVANDEKHQYFIPEQTGDYIFAIYNDPKDSDGERAATFMIIEHLEVNTRYSKKLTGKPFVGASYPSGYKVGYEFNTTAEELILYVDVPDPVPAEGISGLDMYEAKVFPMANTAKDEGHNIQGIGVPFGKYLEKKNYQDINFTDAYGGYNTDIEGYLIPEMRVSCESAGVDMKLKIERPGGNRTGTPSDMMNVFYYIVLLAEYFEGEVEFYIKTDSRPVNLTLVDKPEVGYTGETTLIKVETESVVPVRSMWMEYTTDSWKTKDQIELLEKTDFWLAVLPRFELHQNVEYRIHAKDEIDNKGLNSGSFVVMNKIDINYGVSSQAIQGGQTIHISGASNLPYIDLTLNVEYEETIQEISLKTAGDGSFEYDYKPKNIGIYSLSLSYAGDEDYHSSTSVEKSFQVDPRELELICLVSQPPHKSTLPLEVHGKIIPAIQGLNVEVIFVSPDNSFIEVATTRGDGSYSIVIEPETVGRWELLPQLKASDLFKASQGSLVQFEVVNLSPVDIVRMKVLAFTEPPLLYAPIGGFTFVLAILEFRTGFIRKRFRNGDEEPEDEDLELDTDIDDQESVGSTTYKRRSARNT